MAHIGTPSFIYFRALDGDQDATFLLQRVIIALQSVVAFDGLAFRTEFPVYSSRGR